MSTSTPSRASATVAYTGAPSISLPAADRLTALLSTRSGASRTAAPARCPSSRSRRRCTGTALRSQPYAGGGTRTPTAIHHQDLNLARLPVPPRPPARNCRVQVRMNVSSARMAERDPDVVIEHPNREKATNKATKAVVLLLLLGSAALVAIVTIGGWAALEGAKILQIGYILLYLVMAYFVARWNRGVLPVAAALAIVLLIFAAVAGPEWFARDKAGFNEPALNENVLGLVTFIIVPVQIFLIAFAMRGFQQAWNVEVERYPDGSSATVS